MGSLRTSIAALVTALLGCVLLFGAGLAHTHFSGRALARRLALSAGGAAGDAGGTGTVAVAFQPSRLDGPFRGGPIGYFVAKCQACHGPYGEYHKEKFEDGMPDAQLADWVARMSRDQARSPINGVDLSAQVAFHQAIRDEQPFVTVLSFEQVDPETVVVRGELLPGTSAAVWAWMDGTTEPRGDGPKGLPVERASTDELARHLWVVRVPWSASKPLAQMRLRVDAKLARAQTSLRVPERWFSGLGFEGDAKAGAAPGDR